MQNYHGYTLYAFTCILFNISLVYLMLYNAALWSTHHTSVIITTLIIHHPIILSFQPQNVSLSQILPSIDIWHPFQTDFCLRLSFLFQFFEFQLALFHPFLVFLISGFYLCHNHLFLDFFSVFYITVLPFQFLSFHFPLKHFQFFLVYVLD